MSAHIIPYLQFNENAQFYILNEGERISISFINRLFQDISTEKIGNRFLLNLVSQLTVILGKTIKYHICAYKIEQLPSILTEEINVKWMEQKVAYLLIIEIDNCIVIFKKNISGINSLLSKLSSIDYSIITTLFVEGDTQVEKLGLIGTNISDSSIREKQYEATDLKSSYSFYGSNNYILNNIRLNNNSKKVAIASNTSRIAELGNKGGLNQTLIWAVNVAEKIANHVTRETFFTIFAQPLEFEAQRDSLVPIAILFSFNRLKDSYEHGEIRGCFYESNGVRKPFNLLDYIDEASTLFQVTLLDDDRKQFTVINSLDKDLYIQLNAKSITIKSKKLKNIVIQFEDARTLSLLDYINNNNLFIVNFEHADIIYANRKLFRDHKLLNSIDYFLKIFITHPELNTVTSEKGEFRNDSVQFSDGSIFNFVESKFIDDYDFMICDDLGKEWTDHIGLKDNKISFFSSKHGTSYFSATSFQDIVAQVQKNLGNIKPIDFQIDEKRDFWNNNYNGDSVNTLIRRLRKGDSIDSFIELFKELRLHPNLIQEVNIVLDFISKNDLIDKLNKLKNGEAFGRRNEAIQILWYISSLISSCSELGIDIYIHCKP